MNENNYIRYVIVKNTENSENWLKLKSKLILFKA